MQRIAWIVTASIFMLPLIPAYADEHNAKNFITVATGNVPSATDPKVKLVERQLDAIETSCIGTISGFGIHDKLAKGHSLLTTQQSLLGLLSDFVRVAKAQCSQIDSSTLISLYVLERNAGGTHSATVAKLINAPYSLVAKWSKR